jgi:tRNA nucleotidyltransferase/poly(A) polymerase
MRRVRLGEEARAALSRAASLARQPVWLVGGAIRDAALGRPVADLDLACRDARALAAALARGFRGTLVTLDADNEVYRLVLPVQRGRALKQFDVAALQGATIEEDLLRRDFTVNAVALPLAPDMPAAHPPSAFVDPRGGLADLAARRLRGEIERNFVDDPLRLLRAFRVAAQNGLSLDPATAALVRKHRRLARRPAAERVSAELLALLGVPGASAWLRRMDECGLLTQLFEDLEPARRCAEDYYGPGGVLAHTLEVCARLDLLLDETASVLPPALAKDLGAHLAERGGPAFRGLLMLSALLHDVAKPETARRVDGRLRFFEHDTKGADKAERLLRELRLSREQVRTAGQVVRHHLRPGHLASAGVPTDRAVYRFLRDLGEDAPALLLVCWADHASYLAETRLRRLFKAACADPARSDLARVRGEDARKTVRHLQIVALLMNRWRDQERRPPPPKLVDGTEVMKHLRLPPGPRIGELLERVREAQAEGRVRTREDALALLSRLK